MEWQATLYLTFIDFEKAFDSLNRNEMWKILKEYGMPRKILNIMKEMYNGCRCRILHEGKLTEYVSVTNGVRQGCILSPTIFLVVLDKVMRKMVGGRKRGIQWGLRDRLEDLDFADDICLLSSRFSDMEGKLRGLQEEAKTVGLHINVKKTKEMRLNTRTEGTLSVDGKDIEQVETFTYLGSVVTKNGGADEDVKQRIRKVNGAFMQLYAVWKNKNIAKKTKLRIFNTNVKSVLLYACETWKVTSAINNKIQVFINRCLRRIIGIRWPETISNEELWKVTAQHPVAEEIKKRKWNWIGHTLRKPTGSIEKFALDWNPQGKRKRGQPRKTWKRTLEEEVGEGGKTWREAKSLAQRRVQWRRFTEALCSSGNKRN